MQRGNTVVISTLVVAAVIAGIVLLTQMDDAAAPADVTSAVDRTDESSVVDADRNEADTSSLTSRSFGPVEVWPISHASMVMRWADTTMYIDPVGGAAAYAAAPAPDVILLTDTHGDHLDTQTLQALLTESTQVFAPAAVIAELPSDVAARAVAMANGDTQTLGNFTLTAVPMYNLPEQGIEIRHEEGRGNGYVIDDGSYRVYVAGDTANTPEFQSQTDINLAFVPMNLPYTMSVADAASGVLAMTPDVVVPYHFRTPDGFSDIAAFRTQVAAGNPFIEVAWLDWYPDTDADGV